jgi:hypothetical protein
VQEIEGIREEAEPLGTKDNPCRSKCQGGTANAHDWGMGTFQCEGDAFSVTGSAKTSITEEVG